MFRLPNFNLVVNIWRAGNPITDPPDVVTVCNLQWGKKINSTLTTFPISESFGNAWGMTVLFPALTDVRYFNQTGASGDVLEIPAGSGRTYKVYWVDDVSKGFPTEYRCAIVIQRPGQPVPLP